MVTGGNSFSKLAEALNAIAKATGRPFKISPIINRIRIQKIVYLLKLFNYRPATEFSFNMYFHGPYSPALAKLYYMPENSDFVKFPIAKDIRPEVLGFIKDADDNGVDFLEALVTVLDFRDKSGDYRKYIKSASSIKPFVNKATWEKVFEFLTTKNDMLITLST